MFKRLMEVQPKGSPGENLIEDAVPLQQPIRAYQAPKRGALSEGPTSNSPTSSAPGHPSDSQGEDLEMSPPTSPGGPLSPEEAVEIQPSVWEPYMNRYRLVGLCTASLGNALFDGAAGALIPYMEE